MRKLYVITLLVLFVTACKKQKNCWQGFEGGQDVPGMVICDKSKSELETMYPNTLFYIAGETKYCWKFQNGNQLSYATMPTSIAYKVASTYGYILAKIDCGSFCRWRIYEKHKSKITGLYDPTRFYQETYVTDTCSKLYVGKIVVYRETTDSLITREFVEKY
jgi:hypothetical protein